MVWREGYLNSNKQCFHNMHTCLLRATAATYESRTYWELNLKFRRIRWKGTK
jgi:hypothetical protein